MMSPPLASASLTDEEFMQIISDPSFNRSVFMLKCGRIQHLYDQLKRTSCQRERAHIRRQIDHEVRSEEVSSGQVNLEGW